MPAATKQPRRSSKRTTRSELISSVRGKYRQVRTSSSQFAARKQKEIRREDRAQ